MKNLKSVFLLVFLLVFSLSWAQNKKQFKVQTIAFYNVENLFDTINDPLKDDEKSPIMEMQGGRARVYEDKVSKLARVISDIGYDVTKTTPAILGVAEVENKKVLEDLVNHPKLKAISYYDHFKGGKSSDSFKKYDAICSFSSIEHSGLGRYGDLLDPDGDLKTMDDIYNNLVDDGLLYLGVPVGPDALVWNAHRIYGSIRLPLLCKKFKVVEWFGCTFEDCLKLPKGKDWKSNYQPVIVLKK